MELRQLRYFIAVAEERHFTRAAKSLHVAQSGLSASIRSLERELGASLFRRNTRQVQLTAAGQALLVEARRALAATDAARDAVAAVQGLLQGSLAIGTLQCLHVVHLPHVLRGFLAEHPGLEIRLRHGGSGELVDQVAAGRLDLAFVSRPLRCPDELAVEPLAAEPLVLACALDHPLAARGPAVDNPLAAGGPVAFDDPLAAGGAVAFDDPLAAGGPVAFDHPLADGPAALDHPLAAGGAVALGELADERFVDFQPDWGTRDTVDRLLDAAGVARRVALEVTDVHSLLDLVACGLGVALVPQSFSVKTDQVRFVGLEEPASWETVSVSADPTGAAAAALLDAVRRGAGLVRPSSTVE